MPTDNQIETVEGCGEARTASLATDDTPNLPTPEDWAAILAELHQLRADAAEHYARLEQMWRRYQEQLQQVVDGPERSALLQNVNEQADTIRRLQAENFDLAAGQCLVDSGLGHDEHGHQYCRLEREVDAMDAKVSALAPHGTCGCSSDHPDDLCDHHAPKVAALKAELRQCPCPRPINGAPDESTAWCVDHGHCGCDRKSLLGAPT